MYKSIFIVETTDQVDYIIINHKKNIDTCYIAITPIIFVKLKENSYEVLSYSSILPKDYDLILSRDRFKILEDIDINFQHINFFETRAAKHSYKYFMNYLINYIVLLIMIIKYSKLEFKNASIYGIQNENTNQLNNDFTFSSQNLSTFIGDTDSFCHQLLNSNHVSDLNNVNLKNRKIESKIINFINKLSLHLFKNKKVIVTPTTDRKMPNYLNHIKDDKIQYLYVRMSIQEPYKEILYSFKNLLKHILKIKYNISGFEYDGIISVAGYFDNEKIENIENIILQNKEYFKYESINFYTIIENKVLNIVKYCHYLDSLLDMSIENLGIIHKPLLVSHTSNSFQELIAEVSQKLKIKSFLIAHASVLYSVKNNDLNKELIEFNANNLLKGTPYKYHIIQSPFTMKVTEKYNLEDIYYKSRPIMWGTTFDNFKKLDEKNKTILYVDTSNARASIRPLHFIDIFEYIRTMLDLASSIEKMDNVNLLIRIRENKDLNTDSLKYYLKDYKNTQIVTDKSLSYYLQKADVLVGRSSTAIEESLLENTPVLLYDITNHNKHIEMAQNVDNSNFKINNYVLYLTKSNLLTSTIKMMLNFDYKAIENQYTYKEEKIFKVN